MVVLACLDRLEPSEDDIGFITRKLETDAADELESNKIAHKFRDIYKGRIQILVDRLLFHKTICVFVPAEVGGNATLRKRALLT